MAARYVTDIFNGTCNTAHVDVCRISQYSSICILLTGSGRPTRAPLYFTNTCLLCINHSVISHCTRRDRIMRAQPLTVRCRWKERERTEALFSPFMHLSSIVSDRTNIRPPSSLSKRLLLSGLKSTLLCRNVPYLLSRRLDTVTTRRLWPLRNYVRGRVNISQIQTNTCIQVVYILIVQ